MLRLAPAQITAKMRSEAEARSGGDAGCGFTGDPLHLLSGRACGYLASDKSGTTDAGVTGHTGVATTTDVSVTFRNPMDTASSRAAFSLVRSSDATRVGGAANR